jgi:transposase-like protein
MAITGMRGDRSVRDVCGEHDVSEALHYSWRDKILEGGRASLAAA